MRLLAFDISTNTVGWTVLDVVHNDRIKFIKCGFLKPSKKGSIFERLKLLQIEINYLLNNYKPHKVAIEDIAQYMPGVSSANTIIQLSIFNRVVGLTVFEFLNESPELFNVMAIRHGIKLGNKLPKKEDIPTVVEKRLKIKLPTLYKKTGQLKDEFFDQADSVAVALYYAYKLTGQLEKIKKERLKE